LTDSLPPPLVVAEPSDASTTCPSGVVTADAGASAVTLGAGAQIPGGTCTVTVSVTADTVGTYINTIAAGGLQTDFGSNPDAATAGLAVTAPPVPPTVAKAFAPEAIAAGDISLLTITLDNSNAAMATLSAALTDNLPASMTIASPANASTTCLNGSVVADAGSAAVTLAAGAQIPAAGSCSVTVSVSSDMAGAYTNLISAGALQTDFGSSAGPATALLTVSPSNPTDTIFADGFDGLAP
jgi:hypothetical protein